MKIVYAGDLEERYSTNPVEGPDRIMLPREELKSSGFEFVEPEPASFEDIHRVHGIEHIEISQHRGVYEPARLAAGAAIKAAELALQGEPAFALIRPPGHHASYNRAWGMCFFNNMAVAIQKVRPKARKVLIIDIDLHFGDGTVSIFRGDRDIKIVNPGSIDLECSYLSLDSSGYIKQVEDAFKGFDFDLVGVSAGFDTYVEDWGGLLGLEDYKDIGKIIREGSQKCSGKRFAILEGGYHPNLRLCIKSFIEGFE